MKVAISFTNLGPYHVARLRAAAVLLSRRGATLTAYETAGTERRYPWQAPTREEPFERVRLFPGQTLEDLNDGDCAMAMEEALDLRQPDVVAVSGYVRPEVLAATRWAKRTGRPAILMSESQEIDRPRQWWRELIKKRRIRQFDSALVGGESHKAYLEALGMTGDRIALGYNAVDNRAFAARAQAAKRTPRNRSGVPSRPFFLSVCRFAEEKNLPRLIEAFALYRERVAPVEAWDLVLCGGGELEAAIDSLVTGSESGRYIHRPGFLQAEQLAPWYAYASAFVLPSVSEPWGLVVNEAAACGLPLLVSERAGAAGTLVPEPKGITGTRFDPLNVEEMAESMRWISTLGADDRAAMGRRAAEVVADWGPERFGEGLVEAIALAKAPINSAGMRRAS